MGKEDDALCRYFADNERYADLINGFIMQGRQVIKAEDLMALDSRYNGSKRNRSPKYRDLIRKAAYGTDFAIIAVENQEEVHYLMPVRCMGYDVREYERQSRAKRKKVRQEKNISKAEFLSGFKKEDKLHPCITLVLYYGEEWDGGTDLHSLLDLSELPPELRKLVNNYQVHILDVKKLENTEVFRTDLKQVFDFIKYSKDKQKLKELSQQDASYMQLDEEAYDVAVAFTGAEELLSVKKKEDSSMCQALKELLQDERAEGREEGREEESLRLSLLIQKLLPAGRSDDLLRATNDKQYLKQLCLEFDL